MTITKATITIGRNTPNLKLSSVMIDTLRKMRDGDQALYSNKELGVSYKTIDALCDRRMIKFDGGWFLTAYGIDMINYIDKRKRRP